MTFKFGAMNFNFIRVRLGQVRLCYVNFYVICTTNCTQKTNIDTSNKTKRELSFLLPTPIGSVTQSFIYRLSIF